MRTGKAKAVEEAVWIALQTLEERVQMLETTATDDLGKGRHRSADAYDRRAREARVQAERLRELLGSILPAQ